MGARSGILAALAAWLTPDSLGNITLGNPPAAGDNSAKLATTGWFKAEQATETVQGTAKVATQAVTNAGTDDATIVTPKKLRAGFSVNLGSPGYVALPTWLGGVIFQWGVVTTSTSGVTQNFPLSYPTGAYGFWTMVSGNSSSSAIALAGAPLNASQFQLWSASASPACMWFSIGR
jgi:hypothetical protein